jgi:ABC-type multidrug transport system ATPase subunit
VGDGEVIIGPHKTENVMQSEVSHTVQKHNASALSVVGLTKRYGSHVVIQDASFSVRPGEVLGIIGPNGAGKTTLLEVIAGVLPFDSGEVSLSGARPRRTRDRVFYLPDGVRPYADQHVEQVLAFFAGVYRRSAQELSKIAYSVGLDPVRGQRVRALSKGFARRLIWAVGLLAPHPVLLMDEPFDGFDLKQTREMRELLRHIAAGGRSLVVSIHQLRDAEQICDRIVLLAEGRVRGTGTLAELRAQTNLPDGTLEDIFLALT